MTTVSLERLNARAILPARATRGSFGYDLALIEDTTWNVGEVKVVPCGFRLANELPTGMAMLILPRSSLFLKYGLLIPNSPGLVDADFTAQVGVILWRPENFPRDERGAVVTTDFLPRTLPGGTRVAQALFVEAHLPQIIEGEARDRPERDGFGSTGE